MTVTKKIELLQQLLKEKGLGAWVIPTSDPHLSEYLSEHWMSREWISDFTGSQGTVIVTPTESFLWADGRYHIQAVTQLEGTPIQLLKWGMPGVPDWMKWLAETMPTGAKIGFNGQMVMQKQLKSIISQAKELEKTFEFSTQEDLLDTIWTDRPAIPSDNIFDHSVDLCGKSRVDKVNEVRAEMKKSRASHVLVTQLYDTAWLLNFRGKDQAHCPVAHSYVLLSADKCQLFIHLDKVPAELAAQLQTDGVELLEYSEIFQALTALPSESRLWLAPQNSNTCVYDALPQAVELIEKACPTDKMKSIKNEVELRNYQDCMVNDGVAMTKFLKWFDEHVDKDITEWDVDRKLIELRSEIPGFAGTSFTSIPGYGPNGAMMHYSASPETAATIKPRGFFLIDSGGLFPNGTTDITRTIACGEMTDQEKEHFTIEMKSFLRLSRAVFMRGTRGIQLDILARGIMWDNFMNYRCGTGHGVGFFLNVHEGPHNISPSFVDEPLLPGQVVTNEPGIYLEGQYGIRIENIMEVKSLCKNDDGEFLGFEAMTLAPIDMRAILVEKMEKVDIDYINNYHQTVWEKLSPKLNADEQAWLKQACKAIG